jgi:hypothetical protein
LTAFEGEKVVGGLVGFCSLKTAVFAVLQGSGWKTSKVHLDQ